jgi:hypothetical protein
LLVGQDMGSESIDFARLFRLRLVVARHGEMDGARWWNTQGLLGPRGATVLRRGFPTSHYFAQARVVFAVARARCSELFDPPGCMTLWSLPAEIEDSFEESWQEWLDQAESWAPFFAGLAGNVGGDLLESLARFELVSAGELEAARKLRRAAENRAVPLPGTHRPNDETFALLAAGFARGEPGSPAIPYAKLEA